MSSDERERPQRALQRAVGERRAATSSPTPIAVLDGEARSPTGAGPGRRGWRSRTARCARRARRRRRRRTAARGRRTPPGTQSATTSSAAIAANIAQPHRALLGVDDAGQPRVADPRPPQHAEHQQALGRGPPRSARAAISAVHCVSASTKTRSKKSSSGVTRAAVAQRRRRRGVREACSVVTARASGDAVGATLVRHHADPRRRSSRAWPRGDRGPRPAPR